MTTARHHDNHEDDRDSNNGNGFTNDIINSSRARQLSSRDDNSRRLLIHSPLRGLKIPEWFLR